MSQSPLRPSADGYYLNRTPWFAFILLCCIFALWAAAASMNDVLIAHFKKAFLLSDFQTAFVQSAFYLGYFFLALPAALMVRASATRRPSSSACSSTWSAACCSFRPPPWPSTACSCWRCS